MSLKYDNADGVVALGFVDGTRVTDAASCERWLAEAPLNDPYQGCSSLTALLEEIEESIPADRGWLEICDRLDNAIWGAIDGLTKRFSGRAVPLAGTEVTAFNDVYALLAAYSRGYKRLLCTAIDDPRSPIAKEAPRIAFRSMLCGRELALAHYRARRELTTEVWEELNEIYRLAEQEGLGAEPARLSSLPQSCEQLYIETALVHLVQPYGRSANDLRLLIELAREWAPLARIRLFQADHSVVSVDLKADDPPAFRRIGRALVRPDTRVIDLRDVKQVLQSRIRTNEDEAKRAPLEFAAAQPTEEVLPLLHHLYNAWFKFPQPRRFKRRIVTDRAEVIIGLDAIHASLAGGPVGPLQRPRQNPSRGSYERLRMFGQTPGTEYDSVHGEPDEDSSVPERWDLLDKSPAGFRIRRRESGAPIHHRQLVAIRPPGAKALAVAETRWLMMGIDGAVSLGLQALAGAPQPVLIHAAPTATARGEAGLSLGVALADKPGSTPLLIAARGRLISGAMVDIETSGVRERVRLTARFDGGYDYDLFSCTAQV